MSRKISPFLISTFSEGHFSSSEQDVFDIPGRSENHHAKFHQACDYRKDDRLGGSVRDSFQSDEDGSRIYGGGKAEVRGRIALIEIHRIRLSGHRRPELDATQPNFPC
jgi:hypothetical protein